MGLLTEPRIRQIYLSYTQSIDRSLAQLKSEGIDEQMGTIFS